MPDFEEHPTLGGIGILQPSMPPLHVISDTDRIKTLEHEVATLTASYAALDMALKEQVGMLTETTTQLNAAVADLKKTVDDNWTKTVNAMWDDEKKAGLLQEAFTKHRHGIGFAGFTYIPVNDVGGIGYALLGPGDNVEAGLNTTIPIPTSP